MPKSDSDRTVPRYSEAAGVENHAQITDFVPRRYRAIALLMAAGIFTTAMLALLHYFAAAISAAVGATKSRPLTYGTWKRRLLGFICGVIAGQRRLPGGLFHTPTSDR